MTNRDFNEDICKNILVYRSLITQYLDFYVHMNSSVQSLNCSSISCLIGQPSITKTFCLKDSPPSFLQPHHVVNRCLKVVLSCKCNENVSVNLTVKLMTKITDLVNYWLKWSETLTGLCVTAPPRWRWCLLGRTSTEVPSWWTCRRPWATRPEFRPAGRDCSRWETWPTNLHTLIFTLQVIKLKLMNTERYYQLQPGNTFSFTWKISQESLRKLLLLWWYIITFLLDNFVGTVELTVTPLHWKKHFRTTLLKTFAPELVSSSWYRALKNQRKVLLSLRLSTRGGCWRCRRHHCWFKWSEGYGGDCPGEQRGQYFPLHLCSRPGGAAHRLCDVCRAADS